ncbi:MULTISPECIES: O-succinylhomoserine sulfhydrylase [Marinimicrobium]|jgi:O-succinylhomoserine sulfhydrylase|uniref:O-succinylhomoserine sulfhydrylase n=1 Tax=Marinimicrobium koreense TaxID=306545 RepID=A0A3N1NY87_9GAMM|nr:MULTISPECIES: O-succinylhomoserine sulfhydrylase [Marinimicrobium]MAN52977.1 O-succinylhomoserine sulfhydrylase [Marinimicrobium sp.]ROQ20361.1 O-succinylhomoserine sulfhydrylase [Marinimicrobium koreense]|tara:strand:+ start:604 stop:1791 length:1188 start_codon:yes stop_codon:yes gene_type:complete
MSEYDDSLTGAGLDTLAVRAGCHRTAEGEHSEALFLTSSYVFGSAQEAADRFSGDAPGNVYSRYTNPTVRAFEERIAALEKAESAIATASGMSAILSTCMALLQVGDHILCSRSVFGTTTVLFTKYLQRFGVGVTFVDPTDLTAWERGFQANTRLVFVETPSNPLCDVVDLQALADLTHARGARLVVDNCFCTPALQRPIEFGADLIIHSATKYIDGQGRCLGGVVAGDQDTINDVLAFVRSAGPTLSAFNAWVFLKGLETLRLRMEAHSRNAQALAEWLQRQPQVERVYYAGLPEHPGHELARKQQSAFGGVLSFQVKGDQAAAWRVIDSTRICSLTANLGDAKTTIVHPATTTHGRLTPEQRAESGIADNLIRLAVGLEDVEDLKNDLLRGLS